MPLKLDHHIKFEPLSVAMGKNKGKLEICRLGEYMVAQVGVINSYKQFFDLILKFLLP